MRDEANQLERDTLDMVVMAQIMAFLCVDGIVGPSHKHASHQRQALRVNAFFHMGKRICRDTFLALHAIGKHNNKLTFVTFVSF